MFTDASPPPNFITCTLVLKNSMPSVLASHTFFGVPVLRSLSVERRGIHCITIGTLLALLQNPDDTIPECLSTILDGTTTRDILVATTRVPDFSEAWQSPLHGFRWLGPLRSINRQLASPGAHLNPRAEVFAVHTTSGNTALQSLYETWGPMEVVPENHFIVIFSYTTHDSPLSTSGATGLGLNLCSFHSPTNGSPIFPSPMSSGNSPLLNFTPVMNQTARTSHPSGSSSPQVFSPTSEASSSPLISRQGTPFPLATSESFPSAYSGTTALNDTIHSLLHTEAAPLNDMNLDSLGPSSSVEHILAVHEIPASLQNSARHGKHRSLTEMVSNYNNMKKILAKLDLLGAHPSVTFHGGRVLTADEVLGHFGWSVTSYSHKTTWYDWAEGAAQRRWKGNIPGEFHFCLELKMDDNTLAPEESSSSEYELYKTWLGITFMWGPGGPAETGKPPRQGSLKFDECQAHELAQKHISDRKSRIEKHLQ